MTHFPAEVEKGAVAQAEFSLFSLPFENLKEVPSNYMQPADFEAAERAKIHA